MKVLMRKDILFIIVMEAIEFNFRSICFSSDGQSVTINGLRTSESNIVVSTTLKKESLKSKQKEYIRSQKKLLKILQLALTLL